MRSPQLALKKLASLWGAFINGGYGMLTDIDIKKLLELVRHAGRYTEDRAGVASPTEKGKNDFVTETDLGIQEYLRSELFRFMPQVSFYAEERDEQCDASALRWILDPIDGTTNFIHGLMHFAVSLALARGDDLLFGCVYCPVTDQCFYALKGGGAFVRCGDTQKRLFVSETKSLSDALVAVGTSPYHKELADGNFRILRAIFDRAQDIRRLGSAALDCCYVAEASVDAYFERALQPWDHAAGSLILTEAGGTVTDLEGNAPSLCHPSDIVATNGILHTEFIKLIKDNI